MKVIKINGNKVTIDLNEEEEGVLFRHGLQIWIDKNFGANKVKVMEPHLYKGEKIAAKHSFELPSVLQKECIQMAFNEGLKRHISIMKKEKGKNASKRPNKKIKSP